MKKVNLINCVCIVCARPFSILPCRKRQGGGNYCGGDCYNIKTETYANGSKL